MIEVRRRQLNFAEGFIAEEVGELWEDWMRQVDEVLADEPLLNTVYQGLALPLAAKPHARAQGYAGGSGAALVAAQAPA